MRSIALALLGAALIGCERPATAPQLNTSARPQTTRVKRFIAPVAISTYDGSGQVTHPDVVYTPPGVFAYPWHLVLTPYPFSMGEYENPSVYASLDGVTWQVEPGAVNPVARPRRLASEEALSDPALVYVPESQELWLYYRSYTSDSDYVWLIRSTDAVHWSAPALLFVTGSGQALSPSVVHRAAGQWLMWTVSGRCIGSASTRVDMRQSADGLQWSPPQAATLDSLSPWHVFVRWVESRSAWVMVTNVKTEQDGCSTTQLYLAVSTDGLLWTHGSRAWLVAGGDSLGLFSRVVYRSAFADVGDSVRFWYSGAAMQYRTYLCERGQSLCSDSTLKWSGLGTEIRSVTDALQRGLRRDR